MALSIKNSRVEARIKKLAQIMGLSAAEVVEAAVEEKLQRLEPYVEETKERRLAAWAAFKQQHGPFPVIDQNAIDDDLYNEHGLPR